MDCDIVRPFLSSCVNSEAVHAPHVGRLDSSPVLSSANPSGELWRSRRGQRSWEGREQHRCGREGPWVALLRFSTISCGAFPTQSRARQNEGARGPESCPLLVSTYDYRHSFTIPSNCILSDKLLLLFPPMLYLSASSIHWFCDREEKNL